jgi:asparagine synthase (glutamine-hydrolysing)
MANFIAVIDPNPERRTSFLHTVQPLLPPVEGLVSQGCQCGDFAVAWAASSQAPISWVADDEGATIVWGDAIDPESCDRISAKCLYSQWQPHQPEQSPLFDGFYAALTYRPDRGLVLGGDRLGFFPLYYYQRQGVTLLGSSPELFQQHPCFQRQLDPVGLVGILLLRVLVNERSLWQGVTRLGAGNLLVGTPSHPLREVPRYRVPCHHDDLVARGLTNLAGPEHIEILDRALDRTLLRHRLPHQPHGLSLSGGLDSRTLAGYLSRQGTPTVALTLGRTRDLEMTCARQVAKTLGFEHRSWDITPAQYPHYADLSVRWEHLASGPNGINGMGWTVAELPFALPDRLILGLAVDHILSGALVKEPVFETAVKKTNGAVGLPLDTLPQLLKANAFAGVLPHTLDTLKHCFETYSDLPALRNWCFKLYHSSRYVLGGLAWRMSFKSWPILPVLDQHLLAIAAALPISTKQNRRLHKALVASQFPHLARLPLDRNSFDISPLIPPNAAPLPTTLNTLRRLSWKVQKKLGYDRRFYYRIHNINNAGWRQIRHQAEAHRAMIDPYFDRATFDQLLPAAHQPIALGNQPMNQSFRTELLLTLLLWMARNT